MLALFFITAVCFLLPCLWMNRTGRVQKKELLIVCVLAGVIGSIWLYWYFDKVTEERREEILANMCDERARLLQERFDLSMDRVRSLTSVSMAHDKKAIEKCIHRTSFARPSTSGVAYAVRVRHTERGQFEREHGWTIKKMETEDQALCQECDPQNLMPSPIQDEYAPVILSQGTVSHIVSVDMMSRKEDHENLLRARASGEGVLTYPFKLSKSNHLGVVITFAVYSTHLQEDATPEQRINATMGYLGASYDFPSLVEKLLHQLASEQTIVVNVYDTTNITAPITMYGPDETDTDTCLLHISSLDFGDPARKHEMHCRFKLRPSLPWWAILASAGVLAITLLLGHAFYVAINMMELKARPEAADVAKSQLLARVLHDTRAGMNGVFGMLQLFMDTNLDAMQLELAQMAKNSIKIVNEVMDQVQTVSGSLELAAVPFDLQTILDDVLSLFAAESQVKGIQLAVYLSNQLPEVVVGDPVRFRQIITNLVANSLKFTHGGHIFVSVHLADEVLRELDMKDDMLSKITLSGLPVVDRKKIWEKFKNAKHSINESEKIKLLVTVEDTGVGIQLDAQSRIFMAYMQADSSTSRIYGGTGLGLSISKQLVELMNGEIGFVSEPGTGSTFSFTAVFMRH